MAFRYLLCSFTHSLDLTQVTTGTRIDGTRDQLETDETKERKTQENLYQLCISDV